MLIRAGMACVDFAGSRAYSTRPYDAKRASCIQYPKHSSRESARMGKKVKESDTWRKKRERRGRTDFKRETAAESTIVGATFVVN